MAKYFLGSVGKAEAFRVSDDGKSMELAFVSTTLTDSGLNIQTTKDDIRAGQGAPIQFSFYHDPSVEITLTDVLWKRDYLTAQLGAKFNGAKEAYTTSTVTFSGGTATLDANVLPLPVACTDKENYVVWGTKVGKDDWKAIDYDNGTLTLDGAEGQYCVRYLTEDNRANVAEISTQIIPEELFLIISAPIFAGDSCAASKGKAAGSITFEIPRFQLNGAQEFQMNMSSNQTMSLSGIALATESSDCKAIGGKLLRVIEVIDEFDYTADVKSIMSDEEYDVVGQVPRIYGIKGDGSVIKLENKDLTFDPVLTGKVYTSAVATTITLREGITTTADVQNSGE